MPRDEPDGRVLVRRLLAVRIRRWYIKLLFAVGVWISGFPVIALFDAVGAPIFASDIANSVVTLFGIGLGARWFRGRDEPVEPPRPWWKMTARRPLSLTMGILAAVGAGSTVLVPVGAAMGNATSIEQLERLTVFGIVHFTVFLAIIAFFYLNSAARLPKVPRPPRVDVPRWPTQLR